MGQKFFSGIDTMSAPVSATSGTMSFPCSDGWMPFSMSATGTHELSSFFF